VVSPPEPDFGFNYSTQFGAERMIALSGIALNAGAQFRFAAFMEKD